MTIRIGINGYGRIGRNVLRALYESGRTGEMQIVAINDLSDARANVHLTRYDSSHGRFPGTIELQGEHMRVNGDRIRLLSEREPDRLPWTELGVDVVHECTGLFTRRETAARHLQGGAGKVLISAPGGADVDATVVYGVNHQQLRAEHSVISNASCTTNCLVPLVQVLHQRIGVERGFMTTVHSSTNDQPVVDVFHKDLRRARSALCSIIPTSTGAAAAVGLVLPELAGCLDGYAVRVPTQNVSLVDLSITMVRETSREEVDMIMREAAQGTLSGILAVSDESLVSVDYNHHPASSIYDAQLTRVLDGRLVKVVAWYDNEWGFSNRMLDTTAAWMRVAGGNTSL